MDCQREHFIGQAGIDDNGQRDQPTVRPATGRPEPDLDLEDRTHYFPSRPGRPSGYLRITYRGHNRDQVLNAVQQRYDAELAKREG